jgi:transketolase
MCSSGKSSHIGSIFSIADILAVLYGKILNFRSSDPSFSSRDRFILSKGHAGAGLYAVLAEKGFFSVDILSSHYQNGSVLSGHISHINVPGVEFSTGSLGHGLSVSAGIALAGLKASSHFNTYVLLSDGECNEGSTWEAAMFAAHHQLKNLIAIVDRNRLQSIKSTEETLALEPFADKWRAFGWRVLEVDAHNHDQLEGALARFNTKYESRPTVVLANSIKGRGVSFMENSVLWHYRSPQGEELEKALAEVEGGYERRFCK